MTTIQPTVVSIPTADGKTVLSYNLHTFSPLDGRSIVAGYPLSLLNKDFTYKSNEEAMLRLMCYVSVGEQPEEAVHLTSRELINEHVPDWWTLVQLEYETLRHNCSFLEKVSMLEAVKEGITNQLRVLVTDHLERVNKK